MKLASRAFPFAAAILACCLAGTARAQLNLPRPSPSASESQTVGTTTLSITYSRPGVKGRAIWGALVPYDSLWRTGANEPTSLTISDDITIGGRKLAAGKYSMVTLPRRGAWDVAFTQQKDLQGASNYDPKQEVLRVSATPDTSQPHMEWMWLGFEDVTAKSCSMVLRWQKLRLAVPVTIDVNGIVLANARKEVANAQRDAWRTPLRAATWCFDNNVALDEGAAWLEQSLAAQKNHANLALKARWLAKDGKKKEAIATGKEAIAAGKASKEPVNTSATEKLVAEWSATK
jgi:hypothetical protein